MRTLREQDHLDPNDPAYYAPPWMREDAKPQLPATTSFDSLLEEAVSKSLRRLDPVAMHEPPAYAAGQWWELVPAAGKLAAAVGAAAAAAMIFVIMIPGSRNHAQDNNASTVVEAPQAASFKQAPRTSESTPAPAEVGTILAASRAAQPAEPAMTHDQPEALLQQFLRWQQKHESIDAPPQTHGAVNDLTK